MKDVFSLRQLLLQKKVVIPKLQRDYAQGRVEKQDCAVSASNPIRLPGLADEIMAALEDEAREGLVLDFVYGISRSVGSMEVFEPIDGQQRLTTLWLIYWYLAVRSHAAAERKLLGAFSYETRNSSRDFLAYMVQMIHPGQDVLEGAESLSALIRLQPWFHCEWRHDASISAMLNMLDHLHARWCAAEGARFSALYQRLEHVCFHVLDLKELGLNDSIYIKMNARGKALTPYENFKVELLKVVKKLPSSALYQDYSHRLDNDWQDLFWNAFCQQEQGEERSARMDKNYFAFINRFLVNDVYAHADLPPGGKPEISRSGEVYTGPEAYRSLLSEARLERLSRTLTSLCGCRHFDVSFCPWVAKGERSLLNCSANNFKEQCMEYALCLFLRHRSDEADFRDWKRFVWNVLSYRSIHDEDACKSCLRVMAAWEPALMREGVSVNDLLALGPEGGLACEDESYGLPVEYAKARIRREARLRQNQEVEAWLSLAEFVLTHADGLQALESVLAPAGGEPGAVFSPAEGWRAPEEAFAHAGGWSAVEAVFARADGRRVMDAPKKHVDVSFILDVAVADTLEALQESAADDKVPRVEKLARCLQPEACAAFFGHLGSAVRRGMALYGHMCRKPLLALAALLAKGWNLPRGGKYNWIHCSCCAAWGSQFDFGRFVSDSKESKARACGYLCRMLREGVSLDYSEESEVWRKFLIDCCREVYSPYRFSATCHDGYMGFYHESRYIWYEDRSNVEIPLRLILNNASRWSVYLDAGLDYLTHALGAGYHRQIDDEGMKLHLYRDKEPVADLAVDKNATGNVWGYVLKTSLNREDVLIQQLCQKADACPHICLSIAP